MKINRDQFLEEGYVILRNVISPDRLAELRQAHEIFEQIPATLTVAGWIAGW